MKLSQYKDSTVQRIAEIVEKKLPKASEILELSCGRGTLCLKLQELGYQVTGTNFSHYPDLDKSLPVISGVDATNIILPEDKKYDCIIFSEAMQNVYDHHAVYLSMTKYLKPGALVIISTPNIMNIRSRLHFLWTGFFRVKWNFIANDVPFAEAFCYHNHPVHLPVDLYYAQSSGLKIQSIDGIKLKLRSLLSYVLLVLPIKFFTYMNVCKKEKFLAQSPDAKKLYQLLTQFETLSAERLVLIFKYTEADSQNRQTPHVDWYQR